MEVYQHQPYDARDSDFENSDSHPSRFSRFSRKSWKSWNTRSIVIVFTQSWVGRSPRDQHVPVRLLVIPKLYRPIFPTPHRFCARQDRGITIFTISRFSRFHDFHEIQNENRENRENPGTSQANLATEQLKQLYCVQFSVTARIVGSTTHYWKAIWCW